MNKQLFYALLVIIGAFLVCTVRTKKTHAQCVAENEEWGCESGTKKCHPLCENRGYNGECTLDCRLTCICREGYLRVGENGKCVPESQCP